MLEEILASPVVHAIGWTLIAFTWQAALVGAATALSLRPMARTDARWRYGVACMALATMTALPVLTAVGTYANYSAAPAGFVSDTNALPAGIPGPVVASTASSSVPEADPGIWSAALEPRGDWLPFLVLAWIAGVTIFSMRLAGGWFLVRRILRHGTAVDERLGASVSLLALRLHLIRPVRTLQSDRVDTPTVVGWLRPVVLLPLSAIAGLSPEQLEAVIAHELAHVRRHDYAVNVLQRISETLFFYHPAVWWLSNRIRVEREQCADDLAVEACGDATLYAEALRDLEHARSRATLAMAATGGSLAARIRRLLGQPPVRERWSPAWLAILALAVLFVGSTGTGGSTNASTAFARASVSQDTTPREGETVPEAAANRPAVPGGDVGTELPQPVDPNAVPPNRAPVQAEAVTVAPQASEAAPQNAPRTRPGFNYSGGLRSGPVYAVPAPKIASQGARIPEGTAYLGVTISDGEQQGVVVQDIESGSPAEAAGVERGDVIVELDGMRVVGARQFTRMVQETPAGRTVSITILREDAPQALDVVLAERPNTLVRVLQDGLPNQDEFQAFGETFGRFQFSPWGNTLRLGLSVENMTPELREFFGTEPDTGVLVTSVDEGSPAADAGIEVGDVITMAGGNPIDSRSDLTWSSEIEGDTVVLRIVRDRSERNVSVRLEVPVRSWRITP